MTRRGPEYRAGVIGLGRIGFTLQADRKREQPASHSAALSLEKRFVLAGGYDRDTVRMAAWARSYPQARIYESLAEMLSDGPWDALTVAVNEESHLPVMRTVLPYRPRLVVLEKPVAPNLEDALRILKDSGAARVPVQVNHERRFSRDYLWARERIAGGRYGQVRTVSAWLYTPNAAVLPGDSRSGRGALIHDGTHVADAVRFLTGFAPVVDGVRASGRRGAAVSGLTVAAKAGPAQTPVTVSIGFETRAFGFEIDVLMEKGRVRIGNGILEFWESKTSPYYEGFESLVRNPRVNPPKRTGYFSGMVSNCADFLDGKSPLLSPLGEGIESLKFIRQVTEKM